MILAEYDGRSLYQTESLLKDSTQRTQRCKERKEEKY
jgi:hypothetical protein